MFHVNKRNKIFPFRVTEHWAMLLRWTVEVFPTCLDVFLYELF